MAKLDATNGHFPYTSGTSAYRVNKHLFKLSSKRNLRLGKICVTIVYPGSTRFPLGDLFKTVKPEVIFNFLKAAALYRLL